MLDKRRIATLIQHMPWIGYWMVSAMRLWQPWRTVGAVGVVADAQGRILVVEHVFHPKFPWGLPGGWMGRHEDPDETVRREVWEETGLQVQVQRPLLVTHTKFMARHLDLAYACFAPQPNAVKLNNELLDYRWIEPQTLPPMPLFHTRAVQTWLAQQHAEVV